MAQEILVRILTESSDAVAGLNKVKNSTDDVKSSKEQLTATEKKLASVSKALEVATSNANKTIQGKALSIKEANAAAVEAVQISRMHAEGTVSEKDANDLLAISYNKLTPVQKEFLVDQRKKTLGAQATKQAIDAQAKSELGLTSAKTKQLETNKKLSKSYSEISSEDKKLLIEQRKQELQLKINTKQIDLEARAALGDAEAKKILAIQNSKVTTSTMASTQAMKKGRAQSGLNNAILLETGRLASDASYGFTAIANNLSQVISLFQSYAKTQGGFVKSIKALSASLLGPAGFLIGIQLLISFGPKLVKFFEEYVKNISAANKVLLDLTKTTGDNAKSLVGNFKLYTKILTDVNESEEQRAIALKKLNDEYPDFNANTLIEIDNTKEATKVQEEYIEALRKRALSQAAEDKFREISGAIVEKELQREIDKTIQRDLFLEESNKADIQRITKTGERIGKTQEQKSEDYVEAVDKINESADKEVKKEQEKLDFLVTLIDLSNKKNDGSNKDSADFQVKIFEAKYRDFERIEQGYRERAQKSELMTNQEILAQTQQNEMAKIDIMEEAFVRKEQIRLDNYKKQLAKDVKAEKISQETANELSKNADQVFLQEKEDLGQKRIKLEAEVLKYIDSLRTIQIRKDANRAEQDYDKMLEAQRKFRLDSANILKLGFGDEEAFYNARKDALSKDIERQQEIVDNAKNGSLLQTQAQIELFNLQDKLRQNDLNKEKAFISEKQRINMAYVGYMQGISQLMNTLAGENEALQKAALVLEKGAAIGSIVIDASSSIAKARANTAVANTAAMAMPFPFGGIQIAANEAMFAKETLRTKIGAGIGIANILATTISSFRQPSAGGGGGGQGASVQAPDINLVGSSPVSQLSQVVGGGKEMPIKAYVTSKDVLDSIDEYNRNVNASAI